MDIKLILISAVSMGLLGLFFAIVLAYASKKLSVPRDERVEKIIDVLPNANCGGCGYSGCAEYAKAIVAGAAEIHRCPVGGEEVTQQLAEIMGVEATSGVQKIAKIMCSPLGTNPDKFTYKGVDSCAASKVISGGVKMCSYGCIGLGDCIKVCPVDAISKNEKGQIIIDEETCIGCGKCVEACPQNIIDMVPKNSEVHVLCKNLDLGKAVKDACNVGCIACRLCVKKCEYDAIHVVNNVAQIDYNKCTNCGECVKVCPVKCIFEKNGKLYVEANNA